MRDDEDNCTKQATPVSNQMACRDSALRLLEGRIQRSAKRTEALETLARVIPWKVLSARDEEILWDYFASDRP